MANVYRSQAQPSSSVVHPSNYSVRSFDSYYNRSPLETDEILIVILGFLNRQSLGIARLVSRYWAEMGRQIINRHCIWKDKSGYDPHQANRVDALVHAEILELRFETSEGYRAVQDRKEANWRSFESLAFTTFGEKTLSKVRTLIFKGYVDPPFHLYPNLSRLPPCLRHLNVRLDDGAGFDLFLVVDAAPQLSSLTVQYGQWNERIRLPTSETLSRNIRGAVPPSRIRPNFRMLRTKGLCLTRNELFCLGEICPNLHEVEILPGLREPSTPGFAQSLARACPKLDRLRLEPFSAPVAMELLHWLPGLKRLDIANTPGATKLFQTIVTRINHITSIYLQEDTQLGPVPSELLHQFLCHATHLMSFYAPGHVIHLDHLKKNKNSTAIFGEQYRSSQWACRHLRALDIGFTGCRAHIDMLFQWVSRLLPSLIHLKLHLDHFNTRRYSGFHLLASMVWLEQLIIRAPIEYEMTKQHLLWLKSQEPKHQQPPPLIQMPVIQEQQMNGYHAQEPVKNNVPWYAFLSNKDRSSDGGSLFGKSKKRQHRMSADSSMTVTSNSSHQGGQYAMNNDSHNSINRQYVMHDGQYLASRTSLSSGGSSGDGSSGGGSSIAVNERRLFAGFSMSSAMSAAFVPTLSSSSRSSVPQVPLPRLCLLVLLITRDSHPTALGANGQRICESVRAIRPSIKFEIRQQGDMRDAQQRYGCDFDEEDYSL